MSNPSKTIEAIKEELAAIEHERWSDWQRYMFLKMYPEKWWNGQAHENTGNLVLDGEWYKRWRKQMDTTYTDLSEAEKNSDREQVDRYWPLIEAYIAQAKEAWTAEARIDELTTFPEFAARFGFEHRDLVVEYQDGTNSGVLESRKWLNEAYQEFEIARKARLAELQTELTQLEAGKDQQ